MDSGKLERVAHEIKPRDPNDGKNFDKMTRKVQERRSEMTEETLIS